MKKLLPLFLAMLTCLPSCYLLQREAVQRYFRKKALDATFALYEQDSGDEARFVCSATIFWRERISHEFRYLLITAGHCVSDISEESRFTVAKEIGATLLPVEVMRWKLGDDEDFAELELRTTQKFPALVLAKKYDGQRGDAIFCANFSDGLSEQAAEGRISSEVFENFNERKKRLFLAHIFRAPGISGAAVVSERTHEIIGIVTTGFGRNLGFGVEPMSRKVID